MFGAQHDLFRTISVHLERRLKLAMRHAAMPAQEVKGGISSDP